MDSLGDRMKHNYEDVSRVRLTRRTPVIVRLDGKAFHTLTRGCRRPFDVDFINAMVYATASLFDFIGGNLKLAYVQSDEVSLLLTDWDTLTTEAFFDYNIQKLVSTVAAKMSVEFTYVWEMKAVFDARAFNIPKEEVANYFVWRQKDWVRNSVQMYAQSLYSHGQLHGKSIVDIHDMIHEDGLVPWSKLSDRLKNGVSMHKFPGQAVQVNDGPIFTENRTYIERMLDNV